MPEEADGSPPSTPRGAPPAPGTSRPERRPHPWRRHWQRHVLAVLLAAAVVAAALRAPAAARDFAATFAHLRADRLFWLAIAAGAEVVSFVCFAALQALLLAAGGARVRLRLLLRLSIASSGLRALLPVGVLPSSGWLLGEYRRIGVSGPVALYAVLASGFISTVSLLGLVLLGAAIGGIGGPLLLAPSGLVLVVGSAGFVVVVHRLTLLRRLEGAGEGRIAGLARQAARLAAEVGHVRAGPRLSAAGFATAAGNWLTDVACLVAAFSLLGVAVPWRGLLFAYTVSQLAGSIVPLPGGLGAVEGGLIGALDLLGVSVGSAVAVAIVYRVVNYWGVAVVGGVELALLARHPPDRRQIGPGEHGRTGGDAAPAHESPTRP